MIRKLWGSMLAVCMAFGLFGSLGYAQELEQEDVSITVPRNVARNDTFQVRIEGRHIAELYAYELMLEYDTDKLELLGMESSLPGRPGYAVGPLSEGGRVTYAYTKTGDAPMDSGDLTLGTITFRAKRDGEAVIALRKATLADNRAKLRAYTLDQEEQISVTAAAGGNPGAPGGERPVIREPDEHRPYVTVEVNPRLLDGTAAAVLGSEDMERALSLAGKDADGHRTVVIEVGFVQGASRYATELPAGALNSPVHDLTIRIVTPLAALDVPNHLFAGAGAGLEEEEEGAAIGIVIADSSSGDGKLSNEAKTAIGSRPIIELYATAGNKTLSWHNEAAPVTISIPYAPTAGELADYEHLVVWRIDDQGRAAPVSSGRYDPETGTVTYTARESGRYAVTFVKKTFADTGSYPWARKEIEVLASRGIINGTSDSQYSPQREVTRAEFLVLLVRTLELQADDWQSFDDVRESAYYYEAAGIARALGIVNGVGGNQFRPDSRITRQDMMVMTARALSVVNRMSPDASGVGLNGYLDRDDVSDYAAANIAALIGEGLIRGTGNNLISPEGSATRAETAVLMYRVYYK